MALAKEQVRHANLQQQNVVQKNLLGAVRQQ
jgi:hypothetical protein